MMEIFLVLIMFFFIFSKIDFYYGQLIFQNLYLFLFYYCFLNYSVSGMNMWMNMYYLMSMDLYSWGLILLSFWIIVMMIMASDSVYSMKFYLLYLFIINILMIFLFLCFSSMSMILFYLYFEVSLIPVFILILGWGHQMERISSGFYLMVYTLFGSMPLFLMILYLYMVSGTLMFDMIEFKEVNLLMYMGLILAFMIKMPVYFLHLWLPKAHVEAPVVGSMILAGIMLKLGTYGLMRMVFLMVPSCLKFNFIWIVVGVFGALVSSMICLFQIDMKMLVAYSSVVHMSILMAGLMTMFEWGFKGAFLMMIAHGLCSSGLFYLVNVSYERSKSRSIYMNKGLGNRWVSLNLMWFLMCSSNLSFPPSLNLIGEIFLFNSLIMWCKMILFMLLMISFLSSSYTLYLYTRTQHGEVNVYLEGKEIYLKDYLVLLLHWIPLNLLFLVISIFL